MRLIDADKFEDSLENSCKSESQTVAFVNFLAYLDEEPTIEMLKGIVKDAKLSYQRITKVYPIKHDYDDGGVKYTCPVCDQLGNKHQVTKDQNNCPLCNVNLSWEQEEQNE